jgi:formylglycine-generating enzyme required for sulfatase activity
MKFLLIILLGVGLAGCYRVSQGQESDAGGDADADSDADSDSDSDTESGQAGTTWVTIPGGAFQMGSTEGESDEEPVHTVNVHTFEMLKSEVTVSQYGECVTAGACTVPDSGGVNDNWGVAGRANHPVNAVDWNQAVTFCKWIGGRLPSEAEWEYAARNGSAENTYPWGDTPTPTCTHAVMDNGGGSGCGEDRTWPVCSKTNGNTSHGLCDMAGNVWEWVEDVYHNSYSGAPTNGSAWTSSSDTGHVIRGCSWFCVLDYLRASSRYWRNPTKRYYDHGVRCVRSSL